MKYNKLVLRCCASLLILGIANNAISTQALAQTASQCAVDAVTEKRINDMVSQMTLEEKISQMRMFHSNANRVEDKGAAIQVLADGTLVVAEAMRKRYVNGIGGVKNPGQKISLEQGVILANKFQQDIIASSRFGIPALFVAEAYEGLNANDSTKFARPINMAASWNLDLVGKAWDVVGREARLRGYHMVHSPVADIHRDPRFGRMSEGYGEDTYLTTRMIVSAVRGVQGNLDGKAPQGIAPTHIGAVTKHFVGYGQVEGGRNFATSNISPRDLEDQYFPPFMAAVREGCSLAIMPAHGDINGVASHGSRWLLTDVLRNRWGFDGYVVSDAEDIHRLGFFMGVAEDDKAAARLGLIAGVDLDLYSEKAYVYLPELVAKEPELMTYIDRSAANMLRTKFKLGLFDQTYIDPAKAVAITRNAQAMEIALKLDLESMTLLKNDNNLLPLDANKPQTIALIGPLLENETVEAVRKEFGKSSKFLVEKGLVLTNKNLLDSQLTSDESNQAGFDRAVEQARQADLSIIFIGDDVFTAKEAFFIDDVRGDRADLDPVGLQNALVEKVKALGKPVIVVLNHRRTLSIDSISQQADAIIDIWEPGERGPEALSMVLAGKANPSGRLPVTVPRSVGHLPVFYSQKRINFRKNYLFEETGPLYPFGFGLSYTNFSYSDLKLSDTVMKPDKPIIATMTLTNVGERTGAEVVQMYISDPAAHVTRPAKELRGFQKVELAAGESRILSFTITPDMLEHSGVDMERDPGYGSFTIQIAPSSAQGGLNIAAEYQPE